MNAIEIVAEKKHYVWNNLQETNVEDARAASVLLCVTFAYMGHVLDNCVTIFSPCNFPQFARKLTHLAYTERFMPRHYLNV